MGKPRTTTQNPCITKDLVSTTLVNPVVNLLAIEGFPLIPGVAEKRSNQTAFVRSAFPVVSRPVFLRLWTDAFPGGCLLAGLKAHKKTAGRTGGWVVMSLKRSRARVWLEAHHTGHGGCIGFQAGMELGIVVLDRGGGILQAVAGEYTHHGGARRNLLTALDQAGH